VMRNVIILLTLAVATAVQAAECSPTEARRCYLGVPAVDAITKEAEATHPPRHRRNRNNDAPRCQGFGDPGCLFRME
jgi:hypothetical protein